MSDSPKSRGNVTAGMFWMLMTGFCFVGVTVVVRYVGPRIPAAEAAFIRYLVGTAFLIPIFLQIYRGKLTVRAPGMMLIRGVAHGLGVILWFFAMARIPIAEVTALGYLTPVLMTAGAALFFGERLYARRILAIGVGLLGVFIILRPGFSTVSLGQIAQLLAAPLFAASMLLTKKLTETNQISVIVASLSLVCTLTLLPAALVNWVQPNLTEVLLLSLTAALATGGHLTMTKAFALAPVSVLQPIGFLQLLWATLLGALLFGEALDAFVIAGGAILITATTYIAHREALANRKLPQSAGDELF